jgi:hypothetical protein
MTEKIPESFPEYDGYSEFLKKEIPRSFPKFNYGDFLNIEEPFSDFNYKLPLMEKNPLKNYDFNYENFPVRRLDIRADDESYFSRMADLREYIPKDLLQYLNDPDDLPQTPETIYPMPEQTHAPTAHRFRSRRLREGVVGDFVRSLQNDNPAKYLIGAMTTRRTTLNAESKSEASEHRALTPFIAGIMNHPETRLAFMNAIDETAQAESKALKEQARTQGGLNVDIVIVGAGVHGSVTAARLRAENPGLSVLAVDKNDHIGGQFRGYGKRPTFRINSRAHRAQSDNSVALPGGNGNLNPLGEMAIIQLPDITTETYPTNIDMGDAVAINQFFSAPAILGVEVKAREQQEDATEKLTIYDKDSGEEYEITAQTVLTLTGAGERERSENNTNVWTVEDLLSHFGNSGTPFPMEAFIGKSIAVKGGGDSGRIAVELLSRLAPKEAYGNSIAQLGGPESLTWYGVNFESREEFCDKNRPRYQQIRDFIANNDERLEGARLVRPRKARITEVSEVDGGALKVADETDRIRYFDIVIDASNLSNKAYEIKGFTGNVISEEVALDGIGMATIGRRFENSNVYVGGPAAQTQLTLNERRTFSDAIRENTVALWANVPRVDKLAKNVATRIAPTRR